MKTHKKIQSYNSRDLVIVSMFFSFKTLTVTGVEVEAAKHNPSLRK